MPVNTGKNRQPKNAMQTTFAALLHANDILWVILTFSDFTDILMGLEPSCKRWRDFIRNEANDTYWKYAVTTHFPNAKLITKKKVTNYRDTFINCLSHACYTCGGDEKLVEYASRKITLYMCDPCVKDKAKSITRTEAKKKYKFDDAEMDNLPLRKKRNPYGGGNRTPMVCTICCI